jgi:hypothetical protein
MVNFMDKADNLKDKAEEKGWDDKAKNAAEEKWGDKNKSNQQSDEQENQSQQ